MSHRRPIEDDNMDIDAGTSEDVEPASNLRTTSAGAGGTGSATNAKGGETQISKLPMDALIYRPWPRTANVRMNYYKKGTISIAGDANTAACLTFRLNSIYDISVGAPATLAIGAADLEDATKSQPTMRRYWANFYEYYTVLGTRYKFRIRNDNVYHYPDLEKAEVCVYQYEHGRVLPPLSAGGAGIPDHAHRRMHPNLKDYTFIRPNGIVTRPSDEIHPNIWHWYAGPPNGPGWSIVNSTTPGADFDYVDIQKPTYHIVTNRNNTFETLEGYYKPGSVEHDVAEDDLRHVWSEFGKTPKERNAVSFIIQQSDQNEFTDTQSFVWDITMEFIVQVKDVKEAFKYLHESTDLALVSDFAKQEN